MHSKGFYSPGLLRLAHTRQVSPMKIGNSRITLPSKESINKAIDIYLSKAYRGPCPVNVLEKLPGDQYEPEVFLMGESVERSPDTSNLTGIRSFALRLGNDIYPHMKLRISRLPGEMVYVFSVDCHDSFLSAPAESPDAEELEELKNHNNRLSREIGS